MTADASSLERAVSLARQGQLPAARAEAESALAASPDNIRLLHFLGDLDCRAGKLESGAAFLRRAADLDPGDAASRLDLAFALAALGRTDEALGLCEETPDSPLPVGLLRLRGQLLQSQDRSDEARSVYERVVALDPRDWEIWNNLGNARRALGDLAGAVDALRRAAAIRPDLVPIQVNLGLTHAAAGDPVAALGAYRQALRLEPSNRFLRLETARLLRNVGRPEEALDLLRADSGDSEMKLERARTLAALRRLDEAETLYREILGGGGDTVEVWLELGLVLERGGRNQALSALLDQADASGMDQDSLGYLHALRHQRRGEVLEALAWAKRAPSELETAATQRLIARLADRAGDTELAFEAATRANQAAAGEHPDAIPRAAAFRRHVESLVSLVTPDWVAGWRPAAPSRERPAPVFLVGFPRSGTTLLDTLLMGHADAHVIEEIPLLERVMAEAGGLAGVADLDAGQVDRLRALYFAALDEAAPPPPGALVVDKLPLNILGAPLIHRLFPDARFILALRHPCDVVLSCFMQGFELNDAMANFLELGHAARLYDLVMTFWDNCTRVLPLAVQIVRYEALIADAEGQLRPLLDFLGLGWSEAVLDHRRTAEARGLISTPSYNQVTQKLYSDASGRWKRYEDRLEPVLPLLLPWAERLGYEG